MRVYIYGLFNQHGVCEYVGKTISPRARMSGHRLRHGTRLVMRILQLVSDTTADQMETKTIAEFRQIGQAFLNKARLPKIKRVKVPIRRAIRDHFSWAAKTLGLDLQTATEEAVADWFQKNAVRIAKAAKELTKAKAATA